MNELPHADKFTPLSEAEIAAIPAGDDAAKDEGECIMPVPPDAPHMPLGGRFRAEASQTITEAPGLAASLSGPSGHINTRRQANGVQSAFEAEFAPPSEVMQTLFGNIRAAASAVFAYEPGAKYTGEVAAILHGLGCDVSIIDVMALASLAASESR